MPRNITIKLPDEVARWARRKAAEEDTSLSRMIAEMLERQMLLSDEYWKAFERWKSSTAVAELSATDRLTREQSHERH